MLKKLKIRARLLVSYAIIILLSLASGCVSIVMLNRIGNNLQSFYDHQFQSVDSAWSARRSIFASSSYIMQAMLETDPVETKACLDDALEALDTMKASMEKMRTTLQGDTSKLDEIANLSSKIASVRDEIFKLAENNENKEAFELTKNEYIPTLDQARALLTEIGEGADNEAAARVEEGRKLMTAAIIMVIVILLSSVLLAVCLGIYISNSIRKPLSELESVAKDMSVGNLKTKITYQSQDELGSLADSMRTTVDSLDFMITDIDYLLTGMGEGNFNIKSKAKERYMGDFGGILRALLKINTNLSDTLSQINVSSEQVSSGSDQVSGGAQALSQGATQQASSVEELASTITMIADQVQKTASNSKDAKDKAGQVGEVMSESNQQMQAMIQAMGEISDSSSKIGKIIKTIEDIAFQTNILALNAAVEAARAGAAGKGFAVVADEVRNLASKSAEASQNTASLIEGSIRAVENGTQIADTTAQSLLKAVEGSSEIVAAIDQISVASNEQAMSIEQVKLGIDQIASVVQTNSATAEESAAASEELSGQSQLLKELVGKFQLKNDDTISMNKASVNRGNTNSFVSKPVTSSTASMHSPHTTMPQRPLQKPVQKPIQKDFSSESIPPVRVGATTVPKPIKRAAPPVYHSAADNNSFVQDMSKY